MSETATAKKKDGGKGIGKAAIFDVAQMDELKQLGWRSEKLESGWHAREIKGDDSIGPAKTLGALVTMVKLKIGNKFPLPDEKEAQTSETGSNDGEVKLSHNSKGQGYLPGNEPVIRKDLGQAILAYRATTMEILDLQAQQRTEKLLVLGLMHKYEDDLELDETGTKFYRAGDVIAELLINEKETLKTRLADSEG